MSQKITEKILAEYDQLRSREGINRNSRVEVIHGRFPELGEIKGAITDAGTKLASGIAAAPENSDKLRAEYDREVNKLLKRRSEILAENNIPDDYDKVHYHCELCKDTGYVDNEKCRCFLAKKIGYSYEKSNLSAAMKNNTFDKFSLNYYSDKAENDGISPKMRAEKAYGEAKSLADSFESYERSLLFIGNVGVGKTYLSACIANSLIDKGYSVLYIGSGMLFSLMENKKFNKLSDEEADILESVYECDLLIIDDLGTEVPSKFAPSFMYDVVNDRLLRGRKMVINTNLSTDELAKLYTPRLISRLYESFYVLRLAGIDIRKQIAYE